MNRRVRNVLLFFGTAIGTVLLFMGGKGLMDGAPNAWMYILGAIFAFALALAPGRRVRDAVGKP